MNSQTKKDLVEALNEVGVITKNNFSLLLKENGVVTKKDLDNGLGEFDKKIDRKLSKLRRSFQGDVAKIAFDSPTSRQFNVLEKRVSNLETAVN